MAKTFWILLVASGVISACSSQPTLPEMDSIKVSREEPSAKCQSLGMVKGVARSIKGTAEDALKDLKQEVANRGGNYVRVHEYSGTHTAVNGQAYQCP